MSTTEIENLDNSYNYAGFWIRAGASFIDTVIILLITLPLMYAVYGDAYLESEAVSLGYFDIFINYLFPFVATILFWMYKSGTPGKLALSLSIVDAKTGSAPSAKQSVIRYIGYIISIIPLFLGFFWVAWDKKKQGWHDKMAGTVVVRPQDKGVESVSFPNS
jgi:uncharacterized RDD family membrane protein YckC